MCGERVCGRVMGRAWATAQPRASTPAHGSSHGSSTSTSGHESSGPSCSLVPGGRHARGHAPALQESCGSVSQVYEWFAAAVGVACRLVQQQAGSRTVKHTSEAAGTTGLAGADASGPG